MRWRDSVCMCCEAGQHMSLISGCKKFVVATHTTCIISFLLTLLQQKVFFFFFNNFTGDFLNTELDFAYQRARQLATNLPMLDNRLQGFRISAHDLAGTPIGPNLLPSKLPSPNLYAGLKRSLSSCKAKITS